MHLGDGDTSTGTTADDGSTISSIVSALGTAVAQGVNVYDQMQLQNFNLDRIKSGLPTLTPTQIASVAPQFAIGIAPQTQNTLLMVAAGFGALLLLSTVLKHKRS